MGHFLIDKQKESVCVCVWGGCTMQKIICHVQLFFYNIRSNSVSNLLLFLLYVSYWGNPATFNLLLTFSLIYIWVCPCETQKCHDA